MQGTGEHDAIGLAPQHRGQQLFFLLGTVASQAQQGLVAGLGQARHQCLHGLGEDGVDDGRHEQRHQATAVRSQAAGQQIGHIAGGLHRRQHLGARRFADDLRAIQRPGHGDRRHSGDPGHVDERGGAGIDRGSEGFTGLLGHGSPGMVKREAMVTGDGDGVPGEHRSVENRAAFSTWEWVPMDERSESRRSGPWLRYTLCQV